MKKFTTLLTMAFIALMSISFTSCDDDSDIAYTLDGTWKGNMLVEYGNHNALYSVIRFDQNDGIYSGTGYWIDYFDRDYWHGNNYIGFFSNFGTFMYLSLRRPLSAKEKSMLFHP